MKASLNSLLIIIALSFGLIQTSYAFSGIKYNPSTTEASFGCESGRCVAQAPKSNIIRLCEEMKARAGWGDDYECTNVALFDDGNDRDYINNLRKKKNPTAEEKAILAAANKVGVIGFCNGKNAGNAFVIKYKGKPAVVTSAHFIFDPKDGKLLCSSMDKLKENMAYMPNTNYYDSKNPNKNKNFVFKQIGLEFPPENWDNVKGKAFTPEEDFLVFMLKEDITKDKMLDGSSRGYLKPSELSPQKENLYMLGFTGDMGNGMNMVYQKRCDGFMRGDRFYHGCDSLNGSSSSLIGTYENGEIKYRAVHNAGDEKSYPHSYSSDPMKANIGTPSESILGLEKSPVSSKLSN